MHIISPFIPTSGCLWPLDTVKLPGSPSMSWKSCAKKIPGLGSCEAPCVKSKSQNWDPTSWKSHPKSFQVSVLETASVKIQAPKLRSQVLKTMSWKPYPKISQVFLGLGNPECKLQVSKNWGSHILKIMSKKFPSLGLGNSHRVRPKTEISRPENHVLKNSMSRFWWTPQCKQTPGGQKLRQLRTPYSVCSNELYLGKGEWLEESSRHCPIFVHTYTHFVHTDRHHVCFYI
jgi:hypothetical protein